MKIIKFFIAFITVICVAISIKAQPIDEIYSGESFDKFKALGIPRRLIAIDNVCAWPNLSVLKNGTIIATIFNQPNHGYSEGDVECWASEDGGLSWVYRGTPTQHAPYTNRMNCAAGVSANGELIVLCSGWDNIRPKRNETSRVVEPTVSISKDGGKTWERGGTVPPPVKGLSHHVPFGDIITAANGDLVVGTYVHGTGTKPGEGSKMQRLGNVYAVRSRDGGKTWNNVIPVVKDIHVEAAMLHMGNGKWLAASRRFGYLDLDIHASTDDGFSWYHVTVLGIPGVSSAHLLKLSDGRILLTYGNRNRGNHGIDVRVSKDEGKTWNPPQRILNLADNDGGYPAAIELSGGRIMIAYYSGGIQQHDRYHMGVVNFHINEILP